MGSIKINGNQICIDDRGNRIQIGDISGNGMMIGNNKSISAVGNSKNISVVNGKVYIDGVLVSGTKTPDREELDRKAEELDRKARDLSERDAALKKDEALMANQGVSIVLMFFFSIVTLCVAAGMLFGWLLL